MTSRSYQYPLYKWSGNYSKHGIQLSFGPTYMFTRIANPSQTIAGNKFTYDPSGRVGGFLEVGMVHIAKKRNPVIHYYDWGLGYKQFLGVEHEKIDIGSGFQATGKFSLGYVSGRFDAHNVAQISRFNFIDNGLGFNIDYRVVSQSSYPGAMSVTQQYYSPKLAAQLNYDFGFGIKINDGFFMIPGFNIPFLGVYEWNHGGNPTIQWFSSRYQPILFKLKLVWLFKRDPNRCPPVYGGPDDKQLQEQYLNGQ